MYLGEGDSLMEWCCFTVFRSIKHYFLMDLGDFFVQFMDLSEDEMKKNMDGIL